MTLEQLIRQYGNNSNSFLALYGGVEVFSSPRGTPGAIAYVDTPRAWVGAAEPLAPREEMPLLLAEFSNAAKLQGKLAILIPVSQEVADLAANCGYEMIQIGSEPIFNLKGYLGTADEDDLVLTAKRLHSKGAQVEEFFPAKLSATQKVELDLMTEKWLSTRKMDPLAFLNRVDPWRLSEHKKYFLIRHDRNVLAFVAAIPVWPRNAWYLIDLIRSPKSPPGSTELLLLETMRALKKQGASEVSLGVAPLSDLEHARHPKHPLLYPFLRFIYHRVNFLYNFRSLFLFKQKFWPSRCDKAYLIVSPPRITPAVAFGLMRAFLPAGVLRAVSSGVSRGIQHFNFSAWLGQYLSATIVPRPLPRRLSHAFHSFRLTMTLIALNALIFFRTTDSTFEIVPEMDRYVYSWLHVAGHYPVQTKDLIPLVTAGFLHWNSTHLITNLGLLLIFGSTLEALTGSMITFVVYVTALLLANPLTSLIGALSIPHFSATAFLHFRGETDVGASLGIFGCIGAFCRFITFGKWLFGLLAAISLLYSWTAGTFLALDHITALFLGWLTIRMLIRTK